MKSLLAVTMSIGLLAAASGSAMAQCASHQDTVAEAPMTPIVTAESADTATSTVVKEADKKG
ncbi:hypothetical protein VSX64_20530 [Aurantimonas sp. C2-6-R+9]|uniref:hypothetical protein n=1 Tax=unclassified Aurantimonas TaxID=2638230 RepID=UPI002E190CEF|nr:MULTISPECIES: hypothetical protein [unclassified Aurantimonas]MEC5293102.1 hypothetical protein [Aurantimonas sp. C2-3-R2]MEC5383208.1 hypothetical protein [Aurantimonas sp. C2-6-R+9]MEC5414170.1 hypothetical protein [Aurantimonas sp. C2-4-R8]